MPTARRELEGRPIKAPLHPALVHLPIALFPLSLLLDLASRVPDAPVVFVRAAFVCLLAGIGTALLAAVFGIIDYTDIRDDHPGKKTATLHMILNLVAVGLFAAGAGMRFHALDDRTTSGGAMLLSLVALLVLGYSGYLGGRLVYDDGIAVGRHRRPTPLPQSTIAVTAKEGPVAVADSADLREGATLRVSVNGTVMTLARCDGAAHAVQEFCTHRYGPLSEGQIKHCEVTCPWHGSRFDLRTGKVKAGPAKVDLRTFRVEERDGKLWVYPA